MNNCNCAENQFTDPLQIADIVRGSAQAVAALGFTSLKLDSCGQFNNLTLWAEELNRTGVAVQIENCHQGGMVPGSGWRVPGQAGCSGTTDISDCPYSDFDIILVHLTRGFQPSTTHIVPCNIFHSMTMLVGC